jgi:hypothetical protein
MELQIDTSLLNANLIKNDEIVNSKLSEIECFVSKQVTSEEYLEVKIKYFSIQNNAGVKSISVYGEIISNFQTLYDYKITEYIVIFANNPLIVNKFITNAKLFKFPIRRCITYKPKIETVEQILPLVSSIVKIFYSLFKRVKFNKLDRILINSDSYQEAYLFAIILIAIGYTLPTINITSFNMEVPRHDKIRYFKAELDEEYEHIIDLKGDFISSKKSLCLSLLCTGGNVFFIDIPLDNIQFDPHDVALLQSKSVSLHFENTERMIEDSLMVGKVYNFLNEIENKLSIEDSESDNLKKWVNLDTATNLSNLTEFISLFKL